MTNSELEIRVGEAIRLSDFEGRTSLPATASLEDLELYGGRYLSTRPIVVSGSEAKTEYVILDMTGAGKDVVIYKRLPGEEYFKIHLEMETKNRF